MIIEKILERFRKARVDMNIPVDADSWSYIRAISKCEAIVREVAKEYEQKKTYFISLEGCDDTTTFEMELTTQECLFLKRVSELANKTSSYGCMPRMYVSRTERYWEEE